MGTGWAEDTMMVASLEELSKEGGRLLPLVVAPAETEVDPEEKKLSVTGGETGLHPVEKGDVTKPIVVIIRRITFRRSRCWADEQNGSV